MIYYSPEPSRKLQARFALRIVWCFGTITETCEMERGNIVKMYTTSSVMLLLRQSALNCPGYYTLLHFLKIWRVCAQPAPKGVLRLAETKLLDVVQLKLALQCTCVRRNPSMPLCAATFDGQSHTCHLPTVDKVSAFWTYLENLFEELLCCENFYSSQPLQGGCTKCASKAPTKPRAMEQSSVDGSPTVPASTTPAPVAPSKRPPSTELSPQAGTPAKIACVRSADSEASSTTSHHSEKSQRSVVVTTMTSPPAIKPGPPPSSPPSEWSIEDVIRYISNLDAALATHSDLFRRHEIDGRALLLLNSDMMMKYMGLKLGPALKICNIIDKIKGKKAL
ncbi:hypothetical protein HPB51_012352 [Rhipicephalus microplus]|uniref:SAM domain-containing protein n=1 Tax=Rhipicephalus microplus TaxID=6941 RepID=A0A9J6DFX5_RHIMP|nr:hypothetical protein HPB51_012352 [Rhipicephalus microplus]